MRDVQQKSCKTTSASASALILFCMRRHPWQLYVQHSLLNCMLHTVAWNTPCHLPSQAKHCLIHSAHVERGPAYNHAAPSSLLKQCKLCVAMCATCDQGRKENITWKACGQALPRQMWLCIGLLRLTARRQFHVAPCANDNIVQTLRNQGVVDHEDVRGCVAWHHSLEVQDHRIPPCQAHSKCMV
jgi:hypothetical protein